MTSLRKAGVSALLCASLFFFPASFVFLFPGAFILFSRNRAVRDETDWLKTAVHISVFSLAFWVFSYWITMFLRFPLTSLFYTLNIFFIALFTFQMYRRDFFRPAPWTKEDSWLLLILLMVTAGRFAPFVDRITGSLGDMTQHNAMTKIIIENNGFSNSYEPVMPFNNFGMYPLGFHTLSALPSMMGGYSFYRVTNFMSCAAHLLITLSIYVFVAGRFSRMTAILTALFVSFLSHYPQFLNQWGSGPTALSTAFLFAGYALLYDWKSGEGEPAFSWEKAAAGLLLAAGLLSHLEPPIGFIFYALLALIFVRHEGGFAVALKERFPIVLAALLFTLPFLLHFDFSLFHTSKEFLVRGHESSMEKVLTAFGALPFPIRPAAESAILFSFVFGPIFSLVLFASAAFLAARLFIKEQTEDKLFLIHFVSAVLLFFVLFLVFKNRLLPFSHLLQTERIHYLLLLPASLILAAVFSRIAGRTKLMAWAALSCFAALVLLNYVDFKKRDFESHYTAYKNDKRAAPFLVRDALLGNYLTYAFDKTNASVTEDDIKAFGWIKENVGKDAVFFTNYGDGGGLIDSIAERRTFTSHGMDVWNAKELKAWQENSQPTHIYIGKVPSSKYPTPYRADDLDREPQKYARIYHSDGVSIYEIRYPNKESSIVEKYP